MKKKMLITALALGTGTMMLAASVQAATAEDEMVKYLIACYTSGFYGDCADGTCLVSVAPTETEILAGLRYVLENCLQD